LLLVYGLSMQGSSFFVQSVSVVPDMSRRIRKSPGEPGKPVSSAAMNIATK
jgi:hypothetical protein